MRDRTTPFRVDNPVRPDPTKSENVPRCPISGDDLGMTGAYSSSVTISERLVSGSRRGTPRGTRRPDRRDDDRRGDDLEPGRTRTGSRPEPRGGPRVDVRVPAREGGVRTRLHRGPDGRSPRTARSRPGPVFRVRRTDEGTRGTPRFEVIHPGSRNGDRGRVLTPVPACPLPSDRVQITDEPGRT